MSIPKPVILAGLSVPLVWGLALWGWVLEPERLGWWLLVAGLSPALWTVLEIAHEGEGADEPANPARLRSQRLAVACLGLALLCTVGSHLAIGSGLLDPGWAPALRRAWWLILGVSMAASGAAVPRLLSSGSATVGRSDWQALQRFASQVVALGGLALVVVWLTHRPDAAAGASKAILGAVATLALGRALFALATPHLPAASPASVAPRRDALPHRDRSAIRLARARGGRARRSRGPSGATRSRAPSRFA